MTEAHFVLGTLNPLSFVDMVSKVKGVFWVGFFFSFAFWYFLN